VITNPDLARRAIADIAQAIGRSGLVINTSGNASARLTDGRIAITPNGVPYEEIQVEDVVILGADGTRSIGSRPPSSEAALHLACYEASEASAIVHTHSRFATTLSALVDEVPPIHYQMASLGWPIVVGEYATFGSPELAAHTVVALGNRNAALMRNHGAITIAPSLAEALSRAITLEWVCEIFYRATLIGQPSILSTEEMQVVHRKQGRLAAIRADTTGVTEQ